MEKLQKAERYGRLLKATQKYLDYHRIIDDSFTPMIADLAFDQARNNSKDVIRKLGLKDNSDIEFLTAWSELILFAGFVSGWLTASKKGFQTVFFIQQDSESSYPTDSVDNLFTGSLNFQKEAKTYAIDLTGKLFGLLRGVPSVLLSGYSEQAVGLLKLCTEASLFSGFLLGAEFCYRYNPNAHAAHPEMAWDLFVSENEM